jgi:hypothetical protein
VVVGQTIARVSHVRCVASSLATIASHVFTLEANFVIQRPELHRVMRPEAKFDPPIRARYDRFRIYTGALPTCDGAIFDVPRILVVMLAAAGRKGVWVCGEGI